MPLFSRNLFFMPVFTVLTLILSASVLFAADSGNTASPIKDQLVRIEDKLAKMEKSQAEMLEKQDRIIAELDQLKIWVRRN